MRGYSKINRKPPGGGVPFDQCVRTCTFVCSVMCVNVHICVLRAFARCDLLTNVRICVLCVRLCAERICVLCHVCECAHLCAVSWILILYVFR